MPEDFDSLRSRLAQLTRKEPIDPTNPKAKKRRAFTVNEVAKRTEINQASLSRFLNGQSGLSANHISSLKSFFAEIEELEAQKNGIQPQHEYVLIPKQLAKAGAGSSLVVEAKAEGFYKFELSFLKGLGICPENAILLDVFGNSMEPLLHDRDTILIDKGDTELRDGRIYLVGLEEELLVKKVQKTSKGWCLISLNPSYQPIQIEDPDIEQFRVFGRVKWFCRTL